jgi:pimeloyl-ACP methyl ester carboxylesterase
MWRAARALVAEDARASCRLIAMPTLLLWGSADPLGTARVRQVWCEALPQAQVVVLPRAGHAPMIDQPALFAMALCRFLADEAVG